MSSPNLPQTWLSPPTEFSLAPFWFWNDVLEEAELLRQLDEFQAHGVEAFVIHPRVGLPRHMGWMSDALLAKMRFVIQQAQERGMWVILYDEGMYPSGSASGQVVEENPAYQCRGLVRINLDEAQPNSTIQGISTDDDGNLALADNQTLIAETNYQGTNYAIVERPIDAIVRGLHFIHENAEEPPEDEPLATDLLNPEAVACFIRLVYERYNQEFGEYFGETIQAIFTDEPMLLGRPKETGIMPGTTDILQHVNAFLGYDFTPNLPALWDADADPSIRQEYERAVEHRLEETYYTQLHQWCSTHNIALTGHPSEPDATRHLRYFDIPGQDIVWRHAEPDKPSALEGRESTQGKAAASMMLHTDKRRNANEFCGAYGHDFTYDEMRWLANWLLIRGCNLLIPHAFYYSVRGPRFHERPPDVGLNSAWWGDLFREFSLACRRLCWLNTDSKPVCEVAVLGEHHHLPWRAAKACFENQVDFHYLDVEDFLKQTTVTGDGLSIAGQTYSTLIIDGEILPATEKKLNDLPSHISVIHWSDDAAASLRFLLGALNTTPLVTPAVKNLRVRHIHKEGFEWYWFFNEGAASIQFAVNLDNAFVLVPHTDKVTQFDGELSLGKYQLLILCRESSHEEVS